MTRPDIGASSSTRTTESWIRGSSLSSDRKYARVVPLIAVQPVYIHPYSVAKLVSSLAFLHGRKVYLNMVAGGFVTDLDALADETDHDERYRRLVEYTTM